MHKLFDIATGIVTVASVVHTLLPPWDAFNDFPRTQKVYKLIVYIVGYLAVNARSTVYPTISTTKPQEKI